MTHKVIKSEESPVYFSGKQPNPTDSQALQDGIIAQALNILKQRMQIPDTYITSPQDTRNYFKLKLANLEHEVFAVLFLDNRHGVVAYEEVFRGTIDGATIYPREVVKLALQHNAAAIIVAHNRPSGVTKPSSADEHITQRLNKALALVDIRLLDHLIVGFNTTISLAERGIL